MTCEIKPAPMAPADSPAVIAHINMMQAIITRLAGQSASCKTWCLTLVGGFLGLAGATKTPAFFLLSVLPLVALGYIDSLYLAHERAYRDLFASVVGKVRKGEYTLADTYGAKAAPVGAADLLGAFFSWAIAPFYAGIGVCVVVAERIGLLTFLKTTG